MAPPQQPFSSRQDAASRLQTAPRDSGTSHIEAQPRVQRHVAVTLLCTDMQSAIAYFELREELSEQMVQRHHDLLLPLIERYRGVRLTTDGDALMASFTEAEKAVQAAIAMQRALRDHNRGQALPQQLHIRIGIHSGQDTVPRPQVSSARVPEETVQVTTEVRSSALPDQILISSNTHDCLPDSIPRQLLGAREMARTGETSAGLVELYEVQWDERRTFQETALLRTPASSDAFEAGKVFVLDISRERDDRLKLSAHEHWPGEARPLVRYAYLNVSLASIQQDVDALVNLLNRSGQRHGTLQAETWQAINARGASLYRQLLTADIQEALQVTTATDLFLHLDDALVPIPWELLFDGQTFLCRRFSMGRLVSTQQAFAPASQARQPEPPPSQALSMIIVADPQGDLNAAAREGLIIQTELAAEEQRLRIDLHRHNVGLSYVRNALSRYQILHYAGHADYNVQDPADSGWRLADGKLTARDALHIGATKPMPTLVFCNACQSGQTEAWTIREAAEQNIYGLANAFLLAGAQHYIGSFWEIPDQPSSGFAIDFYRALARGMGVGEALRRARQALIERDGEDSVVWASYVLYGDPTTRYLPPVPAALAEPEAAPERWRGEGDSVSSRHKPAVMLAIGIMALLLVAVVLGKRWWPTTPVESAPTRAYQALQQGDWSKAETLFQQLRAQSEAQAQSQGLAGLAALALARGDDQQALDQAAQAERHDPDIAYSHVIRGNVLWNQGKLAEAAAAYRLATEKPHALPWQRALAYDRLGRLYAEQGDPVKAIANYDKAITQTRDMAAVYANKGHVLDKLGKTQEALELYRKALDINPSDPLTATLLRDAERRQQLAQDHERQGQIDRIVDELVQLYQEGGPPPDAGDAWTSRRLTLAFLDFQRRGSAAARAGEDEFVMLRLAHAMRTQGRVAIVEREVLDKVLAELKLSASDVVDTQAGLGQGKILAARLLATGTFAHLGQMGLVSMRLIDTETTLVNATALHQVALSGDLSPVLDQVAQELLHDIRRAYPLQGRLVRLTAEGHVILNIGAWHGLTPGVVMHVLDRDTEDTRVGRIEVMQVNARSAQGRVLEHSEALMPDSKVQEVVAP